MISYVLQLEIPKISQGNCVNQEHDCQAGISLFAKAQYSAPPSETGTQGSAFGVRNLGRDGSASGPPQRVVDVFCSKVLV